jgi:clan AA aspartic protease
MLQGWLREDNQAVVNLEVICRDRSGRTLSAIIDTDFNGQVSLPRRLVNELDLLLTYEGTVEAELADGTSIEEDVYSGAIRFDGQELAAEIIMTDAPETLIGTGLLIREGIGDEFRHARSNSDGLYPLMSVPPTVQQAVRAHAHRRCEYRHSPEVP